MSVFKAGKKWRAQVSIDGQRVGSKVFDRRADAQAWEVEVRRKGAKSVSKRTVGDLLEKYQREVTPTKIGSDWEHARLNFWLMQPLAALPATVGTETLGKWRDERLKGTEALPAVSGSTVNRDIHLLSHVFSIAAKEWKWIDSNPWSAVRRPKEAPGRERLVTDEEIDKLRFVSGDTCATLIGRSVYAFRFAIETGMRSGEILAMRDGNVFEDHVHIPAELGGERKSGKRDVALSSEARKILDQVLELKLNVWGMVDSQREANFRKAVGMAGIEGLTFHDSRHSAITNLAKRLSVLELARMVGHKNLNMLQRYFNEPASEIAKKLR